MSRDQEDRENGISGGRFVNPGVLPRTREFTLQKEPGAPFPYHFSKIGAKKSYPVSAISALTIGTCWIQTIQFYITGNSTAVTTIPEGSSFQMGFHWHATNTKGSVTDTWSVCIVYWEGNDPTNSSMTGFFFDDTFTDAGALPHPTYLENTSLTNSFPMPARAVNFNFNMFLNDDHAPAQGFPDPSVWAALAG